MSGFVGGGQPPDAAKLGYQETLEALLSLIGRHVLVLFSGIGGSPFISGVVVGRLDRGELDERLQALFLRTDDTLVETLFFHIGSRQNGFVIRPDEFVQAFWQTDRQLTIHLGECAVTVLIEGELGEALRRADPAMASQAAEELERPHVPEEPDHELRMRALSAFLEDRVAEGFRIETRTDTHAIIAPPPRLAHLLARVRKGGRRERRQVVSVDQHGVVSTQSAEPIRW